MSAKRLNVGTAWVLFKSICRSYSLLMSVCEMTKHNKCVHTYMRVYVCIYGSESKTWGL